MLSQSDLDNLYVVVFSCYVCVLCWIPHRRDLRGNDGICKK